MGIAGGCRIEEFTHFTVDDIEDHGALLMIKITNKSQPRSFIINNDPNSELDFLSLFRKYMSLRPKHAGTSRFFIQYTNGKCTTHVMGKNTFGKIPSRIAEYLKLPDHASYTGHCYRSTAISLKSGFEGGLISLSRHHRLKPSILAMSGSKLKDTPPMTHNKILETAKAAEKEIISKQELPTVTPSVSNQSFNSDEFKNLPSIHDAMASSISSTPIKKPRLGNRSETVKTFSRDEIDKFILDASDECYLLMKVY